MNYLIVIPARLKSTRLPNKPLIKIQGKEVLLRTYEQCLLATNAPEKVIVATDHKSIVHFCETHSIQVIMTSEHCLTGTDRVSEVANKIKADSYINVQGDEPILNPEDLKTVIASVKDNPEKIYNGFAEIKEEEDYFSPNIPKVIFHPVTKELIYMSRAAVPANKKLDFEKAWKQVCIYAFPKHCLDAFSTHKKTPLEAIEDIEVLRFLELGYSVQMIPLSGDGIAVDVPEDIIKIETYLNEN
ncbi:3-deoxy-manno-octulosonate cytidylyltransferase [Flavobacteriaceae bacterium]|nr:3-deoxy-manno-octulosonate cytidylyltransferase [Flavobacteriaceae bacterium]